jgi:hypothetical protein
LAALREADDKSGVRLDGVFVGVATQTSPIGEIERHDLVISDVEDEHKATTGHAEDLSADQTVGNSLASRETLEEHHGPRGLYGFDLASTYVFVKIASDRLDLR